MKNLFFYLSVGSLFTHELDAMTNHEWRVLPLVRMLPEEIGMPFFVWAHVPLFAAIIALLASPNAKTQQRTRYGVAGFLLIHAVLHILHLNHPAYEFESFLSNSLIFGGAGFAAVYLFLELRSKSALSKAK